MFVECSEKPNQMYKATAVIIQSAIISYLLLNLWGQLLGVDVNKNKTRNESVHKIGGYKCLTELQPLPEFR